MGRTFNWGGLTGVLGDGDLGGGPGDGKSRFWKLFSLSSTSMPLACFFFRSQTIANNAITPIPRITPIAIPAFAPPDKPLDEVETPAGDDSGDFCAEELEEPVSNAFPRPVSDAPVGTVAKVVAAAFGFLVILVRTAWLAAVVSGLWA